VVRTNAKQREKHILFEPPPSPLPEPDGTAISAREWTDALARARELALTQQSLTGSYSGDSTLELASSQIPSPAGSTIGPTTVGGGGGPTVVALTATAGGDMNGLLHQSAFYSPSIGGGGDPAAIDGVNVPMGTRAVNMRGGGGGAAPAPPGPGADEAAEAERGNKGRKRFSRRQSKGGLAAVF
jgi:hypothetical protein